MALRASRRTELERSGKHPNHVLNDWFGHTGCVAEAFYLQTTEADYEAAGQIGFGGQFGGTSQGQPKPSTESAGAKNQGKTGPLMLADGVRWTQEYTPLDSNQ